MLYVKPNNEKKVAENLAKNNIEVYCPMFKEIRQWSDRKKKVETPFFKSYVFVRLLEKDRPVVFNIPNVIRYLFWLGKPAIVHEEEMNSLKKWLSNDRVAEYNISKFEPGKTLSVSMGALKEQKAIVKEMTKTRVRLVIEGLGIVVNMKIKDLI